MDKIESVLRVTSCKIRQFVDLKTSKIEDGKIIPGDLMDVQAEGRWSDPNSSLSGYPASLHITVYPGCGVIPMIGDNIKITVERE